MTPAANPTQAILDTIPAEARPRPAGELPEGLEVGHAYSYRGGDRMGTVYVAPNGTLTTKPNGAGMPHGWAMAHATALTWTHATATCQACQG